jgi:hypothetical protein
MKFRKEFIVLLLMLLLQSTKSQRSWCWTKSQANNPKFPNDPNKGGLNWGFCSAVSDIPTVYTATVRTSTVEKSETK